jgi:ankyrin repeat protein
MGNGQTKEEQVYQAVQNGNHNAVKALRREGASLEWVDKEGRTPLILACTRGDLLDMVSTLLTLGANLKAYRPGV